MKNKYASLLILLFIVFVKGYSQTATIRGIVLDGTNTPILGATVSHTNDGTITNQNGFYSIDIPSNQDVIITISYVGLKNIVQTFNVKPYSNIEFNPVLKTDVEQLGTVVINSNAQLRERNRAKGIITLSPEAIRLTPGANAGVENLLKSLPGVSNNNELSSQYAVRGGNFDENLVYVNDIEVYRPFLVRSGQQEGLSFVNSDLVKNVKFSAGGFEAQYGDKLSSVLDITYRRPTSFDASADASLLGGSVSAGGVSKDGRFTALGGIRYRDNSLLVDARQTQTNFRPRFFDAQTYLTYQVNSKLQIGALGSVAINDYDFQPLTRQTNFGTIQDPVTLLIFFDGQEQDRYETYFSALKGTYEVNDAVTFKLIGSVYHTQEQEFFDIFADYRLGTPNNNIGEEDLGEVEFTQGVGSQLTHARNELDALFANLEYKGTYLKEDTQIDWGIKYTHEDIRDRLEEFEVIDSAGFSIRPPIPDFSNQQPFEPFSSPIEPFISIRARNNVQIDRVSGFAQYSKRTNWGNNEVRINAGIRAHQWTVSGEGIENNSQVTVSPRAQISIKPDSGKDIVYRLSGGAYNQPPFYRELRDSIGQVRPNVKAQKSFHIVAGQDWSLKLWNRPFKLVTEAYYKGATDVNPYTLENVRIRYRATNNAVARAYGLDTRLNGEFVPGTESWISIGLLRNEENIDNRGYIPRPTDQRFKAAFLFEDYAPQIPSMRLYLNMIYQTGLPGGSPSFADPFIFAELPRLRDFFRADVGFSYVFTDAKKRFEKGHWLNPFKELSAGLEIYNIFDRQNSITNTFVRDASSQQQFAIPNFLTPRVFNVRVRAKL